MPPLLQVLAAKSEKQLQECLKSELASDVLQRNGVQKRLNVRVFDVCIETADYTISLIPLPILLICSLFFQLQLSNRDAVAQNIIMDAAIVKPARLLDQLKEGLEVLGVLKGIQHFPEACAPFSVHTGKPEASDVINTLRLSENESLSTSQELLIQKLKAFIQECSPQGTYWDCILMMFIC